MKKVTDNQVSSMCMQAFMSLMVVLIPVLLISAEFAKVSVVDISQYKQGVDEQSKTDSDFKDQKIYVLISDSAIAVSTREKILCVQNYTCVKSSDKYEDNIYLAANQDTADLSRYLFYSLQSLPKEKPFTKATIACNQKIAYDLIIMVMDALSKGGYNDISLSRTI